MSVAAERTLAMLEMLAHRAEGASVTDLASALDMPVSATHRLLRGLVNNGFVIQDRAHGNYGLTMKMAALGIGFLRRSGVSDIAQPVLDSLARQCRELVRMAVVDGRRLIFVAVAQGATSGLRYDPGEDQGISVHLASSASGMAWLASMSEEEALSIAISQGFHMPASGPNVATTVTGFLQGLEQIRARGFAVMPETYSAGMNAMAAVIRHPMTKRVSGTISISGPSTRLHYDNMLALGDVLVAAADEIAAASDASSYFRRIPADG